VTDFAVNLHELELNAKRKQRTFKRKRRAN
jgi:hypothetical protein